MPAVGSTWLRGSLTKRARASSRLRRAAMASAGSEAGDRHEGGPCHAQLHADQGRLSGLPPTGEQNQPERPHGIVHFAGQMAVEQWHFSSASCQNEACLCVDVLQCVA